ncbi:MAG TPA: hypothetical protein VHF22_02080, partial [Planctomycetota bacterium]|nr:hypothetical protein [Planctomycetota bacterium]
MSRLTALVVGFCLAAGPGLAPWAPAALAQEGLAVPANGTYEGKLLDVAEDGKTIKLERAGTLSCTEQGALEASGKLGTNLIRKGHWVRITLVGYQVTAIEQILDKIETVVVDPAQQKVLDAMAALKAGQEFLLDGRETCVFERFENNQLWFHYPEDAKKQSQLRSLKQVKSVQPLEKFEAAAAPEDPVEADPADPYAFGQWFRVTLTNGQEFEGYVGRKTATTVEFQLKG